MQLTLNDSGPQEQEAEGCTSVPVDTSASEKPALQHPSSREPLPRNVVQPAARPKLPGGKRKEKEETEGTSLPPELEQQQVEDMLRGQEAPGAAAAFVGPMRGRGERQLPSDLVVACEAAGVSHSRRPAGAVLPPALLGAARLRGTSSGDIGVEYAALEARHGRVERAVQQALELHPALRSSPVPRILLGKGLHECKSVLSLDQPLVLAAVQVIARLLRMSAAPHVDAARDVSRLVCFFDFTAWLACLPVKN